MKNPVILIVFSQFLLLFSYESKAQKRVIDLSACKQPWPRLEGGFGISNNGKSLFYTVRDPLKMTYELTIQSTTREKWSVRFKDGSSARFTEDSQRLLFKVKDSLLQLNLQTQTTSLIDYIEGAFQLVNEKSGRDLLIYRSGSHPGKLVFEQVQTGEKWTYNNVEALFYNDNQTVFAFLQQKEKSEDSVFTLVVARLLDGKVQIADRLNVNQIANLVFGKNGDSLAFLTTRPDQKQELWYYSVDDQKAVSLMDSNELKTAGITIKEIIGLSINDRKIFFEYGKYVDTVKSASKVFAGVDVWSYMDPKLQSEQLLQLKPNRFSRIYKAAIDVNDHHISWLENESINIKLPVANFQDDGLLAIHHGAGSTVEWNWNPNSKSALYIQSLKSGESKLIGDPKTVAAPQAVLSPDEKYLLYYNPSQSNYYSYEVVTGKRRNLTGGINTKWVVINDDLPNAKNQSFNILGFVKKSTKALIYNQYDLYQVDLAGIAKPLNLTQGYGKSHQVVFRLATSAGDAYSDIHEYDLHQKIILHAFDMGNKDEGYFTVQIGLPQSLKRLTMQPAKLTYIAKAKDADAYLILRENTSTPSNIYFTKDFKRLNMVSDIIPQKAYNWLTAELVNYHQLDGMSTQGVLYKPDNFDPAKKYPLIIYYYETESDSFHHFIYPRLNMGVINIPYFVSNGYLVFTPDIHYKIGWPGRSAYNSIIAAAQLLSKRPYVDEKKLGIQGHSFGGFETNYVITHSNMFAAAMSASGMSDYVSIYNSIIGDGTSRQRQYEYGRDRIGATLWQKPEKYIENSPVLRADKVTTPLLMMANKDDEDVPYQQSIELFTALRRLGKKVWMLQYDNEGHSLRTTEAATDLTKRVFQFFNYYLKGMPPPKWMTVGIPAARKGIESGLELDTTGKKP